MPGLHSSTAVPAPWDGEFDLYLLPLELRAFGMTWNEIEHDAMTRRVKWEKP
jgi:hypothetical protein